ncbi:protein Shroom4 [Candoia aspera]|uniref:protein Shroom4 n=1 Tax=Candoia aspera TaxID=51853 RepID=UPI002FD816EC
MPSGAFPAAACQARGPRDGAMEQPSGQSQRPPAQPEPDPPQLASRLLVSFQYLHVQLAGGAPWGFTLRGGLEHGEPLIVSKVEDGGKAALSQKMCSGDELVNINGTPLYGSRQEALILIKGSYRTLKMIIRRRNVPIIRPHSWHLAKLSEVRTEAATMTFPADPLSLSWHLGCETSDLPLPWDPLSPHCVTERSGSLESMGSLDPPGRAYYEGGLSPIDPALRQSQRDSAYSSFSASSSTSDSAPRPEESGPVDSAQPSQLPEPRYLQTGGELAGPPLPAPGTGLPSGTQPGSLPSPAKAAAAPPRPPVRQDSLRACGSPPEAPRPPSHTGPLCPEGPWSSDSPLCTPGGDPHGPGGKLASTGPLKDSLFTDQYYLLSSHTEQHPAMEKGPPNPHCPLAEENTRRPSGGPLKEKAHEAEPDSHRSAPSPWEAGWAGPLGHRHSIPEHLLVAELQALDVSRGQEGPRWTVSPLHKEEKNLPAPEPWLSPGHHGQDTRGRTEELDPLPASLGGPPSPPRGACTALGRPQSALAGLAGSPPPPPFGKARAAPSGLQAAPTVDTLPNAARSPPAAQKRGSAQHRSAHTRRRSDRFATNLRNEIQWRKAQLQKAKGVKVLGCEVEPARETEEPPAHTRAPAPPPPLGLGEGKPHGSSGLPAVPPKHWGSELSVFGGKSAPCSPQRPSGDLMPKEETAWLEKSLPPARRGGRWRWSPEHKLQPQESEPEPSSQPPAEEPGLLPFADRRKFFEETSQPPSSRPTGSQQGRLGSAQSPEAEKPGTAEHRGSRRHSLDQCYWCPASPPSYQDFRPEVLGLCKPLARHSADREGWRPLPCSCTLREACSYSFREECAMLHARNVPMSSSHCAHHCHPCPWSCCSDCCCPAQQKLLEDGGPWQARKPFQMELPVDQWEPPAMDRAGSQSISQLLQHKMAFARVSPFWTCFERAEPAWSPFCRAASTRNLSWDCKQSRWAVEKVGSEAGPSELRKPCLRERAYSESHLCVEPAGMSAREWREVPLAKLEETGQKSPLCQARRKAVPPPRPPPPNWEKYRPSWASHQQLLPAQAGLPAHSDDSWGPNQSGLEAARQRSRSLPAERLWSNRPQLQSPPLPSVAPSGALSLQEQNNHHFYCHSSPHRSLEWLMPEASGQSGSPRQVASHLASSVQGAKWLEGGVRKTVPGEASAEAATPLAEEATDEHPLDEEQERPVSSPLEPSPSLHPPHCVPASRDATGESSWASWRAGPPPSRLNSEELMRDVAGRDRSLARVLSSGLGLRSAAEVMGDLFPASDGPPWRGQDWSPLGSGPSCPERQQMPLEPPASGGATSPTTSLTYYNLSASKAELLSKTMDRSQVATAGSEEEELDPDLAQKKVQLIESIGRKLAVLQEAQQGLQDELSANVALGREVENYIKEACKPHELEKFRLVMGDLDKMVNLLLSLSGRLARVENALSVLDAEEGEEEEEEKMALLEKKRQLLAQLEDAKELQEHVAQREQLISASVSRCLPAEQLQDYQHFVRMKSALAIQQRQLDEKIKLGEEQLRCLWESLPRRPREH